LVFVANKDKLDDQRDDLRLFIAAVARGAEAARQDPAGATKALLEANPDLKEKRARASVRLTIPTLFPPQRADPWGYMDPVAWRNYGGWMVDQGILKQLPDIPNAITNDLLPGQGLKKSLPPPTFKVMGIGREKRNKSASPGGWPGGAASKTRE